MFDNFLHAIPSVSCDMHACPICARCRLLTILLVFFFLEGFNTDVELLLELFEGWHNLLEMLIWSELLFRGLPGIDEVLDEPEDRESESGPTELRLLLALHWSKS